MNDSVWLTKAYDQAGREVLRKSYEPALWALAISECEGNEPKAQAAYVKARVAQLLAVMVAEAKLREARAEREIKVKREAQAKSARELANVEARAKDRHLKVHQRFYDAGKRFRLLMLTLAGR